MLYSVIFLNNKLCIYLTVRKSMIIRTAFRFYAPKLSYTISRILKSVPTWGWITNHSGLMKSEWELDADVLSRVGRAKWGVNPHATNNQSRIKMAVNCLPSLGPSAPSPDRSVSCGKHGARGRSSLGLGTSGFQNLDKRYQSINQQISSDHRRITCDVTSCLPWFDADQQTLMQYLKQE